MEIWSAYNAEQLAKHVKDGCRLLDKKTRGWWRKIKLRKLCAQDPHTCILAQVYGNYTLGCQKVDLFGRINPSVTDFGFCDEAHNPYWIKEIRKRQKRALRRLAKV